MKILFVCKSALLSRVLALSHLIRIAGLSAAILLVPGLCLAAGFDCNRATTLVEKLICAEHSLSQLDEGLSKTYQEALRSVHDRARLKREQTKWLREVRDLCTDSVCLEKEYRNRLAVLEKFLPEKSTLCDEFQRHLNQHSLAPCMVEEKGIEHEDFNFSVPSIDVDGDKIEDKILLFHTGSGSIIPADYDSVTLILSSTGEKFTVEMQRFYVIVYKAKYYIVASNVQGEKGPVFVDIKSMDRRGITQVCSYDCGLYGGSCARRRHHKEK